METVSYFGYGSNTSIERMVGRVLSRLEQIYSGGVLERKKREYERTIRDSARLAFLPGKFLVFNKASKQYVDALHPEGKHDSVRDMSFPVSGASFASIVDANPDNYFRIMDGELPGIPLPYVVGMLYELPGEYFPLLNRSEGVFRPGEKEPPEYLRRRDGGDYLWFSHYFPEVHRVHTFGGESVEAYVYVASPVWVVEGWRPRREYAAFLKSLDVDYPPVRQYLAHLEFIDARDL